MGRTDDNFTGDLNLDFIDDDIEFDIEDNEPEGGGEPATTTTREPVTKISGEEFIEIDENDSEDPDEDPNDDDDDDEGASASDSKKKPTTSSKTSKTGDASSPPSQIYAAFAKRLAEDGVLSDFNEEEFGTLVEEVGGAPEALVELARRSVTDAIEEYKSTAEADYQTFLQARDNNIPIDEFSKATSLIKKLESIEDDDFDEDDAQAEFVIRELLTVKGFKPAKIDKLIKQYEALGTTSEEAIEAKTELIELTKENLKTLETEAKENDKTQKEQIARQRESLQTFIDGTAEIIPGVNLSKKEKQDIFESITKPAGFYPNGQPFNAVMAQRSKNPMAFERTLHYLLKIGVFDLDDKNNPKPNWSKVIKTKQTKVANEFDTALTEFYPRSFGSGKTARTRSSGEDLDLGLPNL